MRRSMRHDSHPKRQREESFIAPRPRPFWGPTWISPGCVRITPRQRKKEKQHRHHNTHATVAGVLPFRSFVVFESRGCSACLPISPFSLSLCPWAGFPFVRMAGPRPCPPLFLFRPIARATGAVVLCWIMLRIAVSYIQTHTRPSSSYLHTRPGSYLHASSRFFSRALASQRALHSTPTLNCGRLPGLLAYLPRSPLRYSSSTCCSLY